MRNGNTCPCKCLYTNVYSNFIHNNRTLKTTQTSIDRWMDKPILVHPCNGTVLVQWKGTNHECLQQHEESGKWAECKEARHKNIDSCMIPLIYKWRKKHFNIQRQKTRQWLPGTKAGNGNWMSRGNKELGEEVMEKSPTFHCGDSYKHMCICQKMDVFFYWK